MRGLLYVKCRKFENFSWNGGIAANENETPFFLIFPARMPKCKNKNWVDWSANLGEDVALANVCILSPYKKSSILFQYIYIVLMEEIMNNLSWCVTFIPLTKTDFRRPKVLLEGNISVQKMLHLFYLSSYVYNYSLISILDAYVGWKWFDWFGMSALALKKLLEGNTGDQKMPYLICFSSCV